jgi:hypothetical protein
MHFYKLNYSSRDVITPLRLVRPCFVISYVYAVASFLKLLLSLYSSKFVTFLYSAYTFFLKYYQYAAFVLSTQIFTDLFYKNGMYKTVDNNTVIGRNRAKYDEKY